MLIRLLSDLHQEFAPYEIQPLAEDKQTILVLAGDIHVGAEACDWIIEQSEEFAHVIYVLGNHEFYGHSIDEVANDVTHELFDVSNISLLDNGSTVIGDVRFIGSTLWTDMDNANPISVMDIERTLNDYHLIKRYGRKLRAGDTIGLFRRNMGYLDRALTAEHHGPTVVVTHHLPSFKSVHPIYINSNINGAYASDCERLMYDHDIAYWFHGHSHQTMSYEVGGCKVRSNPFGYGGVETNLRFDPTFRVEV